MASKWRETRGGCAGETSMSPRLKSISSSSVTVTDIGGNASGASPSNVTIDFTRLLRSEGNDTTGSPGRITPLATGPAKPRKLASGRITYCTGEPQASEG